MGNVLTAGLGCESARQALIRAGIPVSVPAMTIINQVCGSGLKPPIWRRRRLRWAIRIS